MYGIDFGTSNTVVTYAPSRGARGSDARLLELGEGGLVPSLLYYERDRRPSIGAEAMADYAEALGRYRGTPNPYAHFRFFQAIKLALKDPLFEGTRIFGEFRRVEALAALFLREVKRRADEALAALGEKAADEPLVLGRPVVLADDADADRRIEDRFREAARLAGFSEISFVYEPVAAAVSAAAAYRGVVLVFDFGGGTLDISVARGSGCDFEILANRGIDLGGYLLNEDVARARLVRHFGAEGKWRTMTGRELAMPSWITRQVASFYALPLADIHKTRTAVRELVFEARREDKDKLRGLLEFLDRNLAFELFARIDAAKIRLSEAETASIVFDVPPFIAFEEAVTRNWFEGLIAPRVEAAERLVREALAAAGLETGEVGKVVRVGGSSRVPAFARMLERLFPGRVEEGAVFTSIAAGLIGAEERGLGVAKARNRLSATASGAGEKG